MSGTQRIRRSGTDEYLQVRRQAMRRREEATLAKKGPNKGEGTSKDGIAEFSPRELLPKHSTIDANRRSLSIVTRYFASN